MSITDPPTLDTVLQAIDALYVNPENSVKESASKWLCSFQRSVYAWEISDQLLYLKRDLSSSYFGAQTIRIKIQMYFTELPASAHMALKDSLLNHVLKLADDTNSSIANQLCLAVADLFCQMVQWTDAISDIVKTLSSSDVTASYLVDVLRFISEELNSKSLRLGLNRRHALMAHLESQKGLVLDFLSYKIKNANAQNLARIFNCLASWWDNTGIMTESDVRVSPLLEAAFYVLQQPETYPEATYNAAMEWILALLYSCTTISGYRNELLKLLQTNIYRLLDVLRQCSLQASKAADNSMAECSVYVDRVSSIAQIFDSLARTVRTALVYSPTPPGSGEFGDLHTLDCLLAVLEAPPPAGCRATALHTFYALQSLADDAARHHTNLTPSPGRQNPSASPAGDMASNANSRPATSLLIPYFTRVVVALTRYCPSNAEDLEAAEDLQAFRDDAHGLMQDIVDLVGADTIFVELYEHIRQLQEMNSLGTAVNVFREAEACLFMLTTVAKRLSPHDPEGRIASLISTLVLPGLAAVPPPPLQEVGCLLYAELSHWVACHPDIRRQIVEQLIQIVERAAGVPAAQLQPGQKRAVGAAIAALGSLCKVYRPLSVPVVNASSNGTGTGTTSLLDEHWKDLIFRVVYSLPRLSWVPVNDAIDFFEGVCRGLMASIVYAPSTNIPTDPRPARAALPERLAQLASVNVECISKLIEQNQPIEGVDTLSDPCVWLDYLSTIFRSLQNLVSRLDDAYRRSRLNSVSTDQVEQQRQAEVNSLGESAEACLQGCLSVVTNIVWPVIGRALEHYGSKVRPMERCCRVIRFMARSLSVNLREILPDIANKLVQAFQQGHHSCFLYLAGVLVDVFGDLPDCRPGLVGLFEALAPPTLAALSCNLAEQPHTIEDFFRLCVRLVQHCAPAFLSSPNVDLYALLDTALRSLDLLTLAAAGSGAGDRDTNQSNGNNGAGSSKAGSSASTAAARFLLEALIFTTEASEDSPAAIVSVNDASALPPATSEGSVGARRLLFWLLKPTELCGGQRLTTSCVHSCCLGLLEDRFPDMAELLHRLKIVMPREVSDPS
uniref:Xpo1 domain-containing protein n=1 Tax=Mesocestoides corti TaxID=53468 RepID=A0A5K3FVV0_MESCO